MGDGRTHLPAPDELPMLYGNPYYSLIRPTRRTLLFNEWGRSGFRSGLVTYPGFVDAKSGHIIVSERDNHRLQIFDNVGAPSRFDRFGRRGSGANQFESPGGVTTTSEPHAAVIVADTGNRRVCLFRVKSDHYGLGILDLNFFFGHQIFQAPTGVEYDTRRGILVVADQDTRRVSQHDIRTGICIGEFRPPPSIPLELPTDVTIDEHGLGYVSDGDGNSIHVYEPNGDFLCRIGGLPRGSGDTQFNKPSGLCFDRSSNLIVSDEGNSRLLLYRPSDIRARRPVNCAFHQCITTDVYMPRGVSVNVHENLVVADASAHDFLKILKYK